MTALDQLRDGAGQVERGDLQPVVLAMDVQYGNHDQVGEDERDHSTETDAAVPQHRPSGMLPMHEHPRSAASCQNRTYEPLGAALLGSRTSANSPTVTATVTAASTSKVAA